MDPKAYDAWYRTSRGIWFGHLEYRLISLLLQANPGQTLLDIGCGTGYFTRHFSSAGLKVTGLDPDAAMLDFASQQSKNINYLQAVAEEIPYPNKSFDYVCAITSLCFVENPVQAISEMWRVTDKKLLLGLLNKNSLLYLQKHDKAGYTSARWDSRCDIENWLHIANIEPAEITFYSAINIPSSSIVARLIEYLMPKQVLLGGFLAVCLSK